MTDNQGELSLQVLHQKFPYIPVERLKDLHSINAKDHQLSKANRDCKQNIDRRLKSYTLADISKYRNAHDIEASTSRAHLRVAVIGTSGSGKSATGNTLLQDQRFAISAGAISQTNREQAALSNISDALIQTVIDTPGSWSIPKLEHVDLYAFVINLASPRFTQQDLTRLRQLRDYNNILSNKRGFLLLTHAADALRDKELTSYLNEIRGEPLYDLITNDMEGWRVMAINNSCDTKYEENSQWKMIMNIIRSADTKANYTPRPSGISLDWDQCSAFLVEYKYLLAGVGSFLLFVTIAGIIMQSVETAPPYHV